MIIGIAGLAGSGKDTAAEFLVKNHNFVRVALADKLKRICRDVFDFSDEQMWGPSSRRNEPDERYPRGERDCSQPDCVGHVEYLTPRYALQTLGTEWGRNCYNDIWTEDALRTAKTLLEPGNPLRNFYMSSHHHYNMKGGLQSCTSTCKQIRGVVIPDVRFKNEMARIKQAGGYLIRMKRGTGLTGAAAQHQSEAEQLEVSDSEFAAVIHNENVTLAELEAAVAKVLGSLC
jgi:hypothetical protein